jgi:surfactin synthase thioesterase subunit
MKADFLNEMVGGMYSDLYKKSKIIYLFNPILRSDYSHG